MSAIPFSKARSDLTKIVNHVAFGHDRCILTRNGRELAAIISIEDLRRLEALEDRLDVEAAKLADQDIKKHGTVSWEEAKGQLDL